VATLLVQCPDAKGVVASLGQLLFGLGCNMSVGVYLIGWAHSDGSHDGQPSCRDLLECIMLRLAWHW
jgi:hypothetical protein